MGATPQRHRPPYAVDSVDNALRLLQMLRDVGEVRGKDAARELRVAPSTVHRLMSMLVYRGFAVQDDSHVYVPGPAIGVEPVRFSWPRRLQNIVRPHLEELRDTLGETVYLLIGAGTSVRFILSVESSFPSRGEDRDGYVLPAHRSAGGRAILAAMRPAAVNDLLGHRLMGGAGAEPVGSDGADGSDGAGLSASQLRALHHRLDKVRHQGFALSVEEAEIGIVCVAVPIRRGPGNPLAAISTAGPANRISKFTDHSTVTALYRTRNAIEAEVAALPRDSRSADEEVME